MATGIRVSEVAPGFVETNFARTRFRGDEEAAKAVYKGFTPREYARENAMRDLAESSLWTGIVDRTKSQRNSACSADSSSYGLCVAKLTPVVAEDIAEEIVWCALRPPHVQIAELCESPPPLALTHRRPPVGAGRGHHHRSQGVKTRRDESDDACMDVWWSGLDAMRCMSTGRG